MKQEDYKLIMVTLGGIVIIISLLFLVHGNILGTATMAILAYLGMVYTEITSNNYAKGEWK